MALVERAPPPARAHGAIEEIFSDIHFVTGTVAMPGPGIRFSRNMTIVRDGTNLVLVNSVRLDDAGLAALDALGKVTDVIRLAANHGMDDPFYRQRYGAKIWTVKGQRYVAGFDTNAKDVYLEPDAEIDERTKLPIEGARLYVIHSKPPEAMLVLDRHGGTVISGDCLQHWDAPDAYFTFMAKLMMRVMGFMRPYNIGPGWLKQCKPPKDELRKILDLDFANVMTAHGKAVVGGAREHYRAAIERAAT